MKLIPLGDRIIIQAMEAEKTTASGIILPSSAQEKPQRGKVLAVGEGTFNKKTGARIPMSVAVGDDVLYSRYSATEINIDGKSVLIVREPDVLLKVVEG